MMDCQKTFRKVPTVKAKEMKPMMVEAREIGAKLVWEIVIPMVYFYSQYCLLEDLDVVFALANSAWVRYIKMEC